MVRTFTALMLLAGLTACATTSPPPQPAGFQTGAAMGKPIDVEIAANGPPATQWDLPDGRRAYQWQEASITARVGPPTANGAVVGAATQTTCYYTLYTRLDGKRWKVVGYEEPRPGCGRLAMNK
jgi:hypothetical protein